MHQKRYKYSEIFGDTFQGEGKYTGSPTIWLRFWGCNFECNGFSQVDPEDVTSYKLDYQTVDVSSIKKMEDLPVFNTGCDSSYSWSKKFSHLAHTGTAIEICDNLESWLKNEFNPQGTFYHPNSGLTTHLAFTGGEPMLNQNAIVDIMQEFDSRGNLPWYITCETNGTQDIRGKFADYMSENYEAFEWFWSVSPKLYLSGEKKSDALKPEILSQYNDSSPYGQLKYVCDGSNRAWDEVEEFTQAYRNVGVNWPVWIMPMGATVEGQDKISATVAEGAIKRGYNVAARVHCYVFGNKVGK
jgi:7-carboxy-7-deazaguanine synthase